MVHFVGLDVSVKETSVCVVDDAGKVDDIIALLSSTRHEGFLSGWNGQRIERWTPSPRASKS